ncbi:hypothetical protein Dsin_023591 [Dipteronia sinensis]|uniref:Uncharacterized protein n=1 Tax=Dipteronia sinensis TaxID=43782 RepID=A0AAE0A518_9ROSI|nr:hypothetical protein Dsin_023591 [Dipteronia sinensis]
MNLRLMIIWNWVMKIQINFFRVIFEEYNENNRYTEIVDPRIAGNGQCLKTEQQLQTFAKLMFKCISESVDDRPTMVNVANNLDNYISPAFNLIVSRVITAAS